MQTMNSRKIYIVASYTDTWPGRLIVLRAKLKFWNRYAGDTYSHVSISQSRDLTEMYSFARRAIHNPFNAGLIQESIKKGMFALKPHINRMAVLEYAVTEQQYQELTERMEVAWANKDAYKFNFLGITMQLLFARGGGKEKSLLLFPVDCGAVK